MENDGYKWFNEGYPTEFKPYIDYPYVIIPKDSILVYDRIYTYSDHTYIDYSDIFRLEIYKSNVTNKVILTYNKNGTLIRDTINYYSRLGTIQNNVWSIWDGIFIKDQFKKIDNFTLNNNEGPNLYKNKHNQLLLINTYNNESVMISDNGIKKYDGNLDDWTPLERLTLKSK